AGVLAWSLLRRRRGVATLVAIGLGSAACGGIGWQLGELLGPALTHAQLAAVGATVTTGLSLRSPAALAVGPFFAVLAYLVAEIASRAWRSSVVSRAAEATSQDSARGSSATAWSIAAVCAPTAPAGPPAGSVSSGSRSSSSPGAQPPPRRAATSAT